MYRCLFPQNLLTRPSRRARVEAPHNQATKSQTSPNCSHRTQSIAGLRTCSPYHHQPLDISLNESDISHGNTFTSVVEHFSISTSSTSHKPDRVISSTLLSSCLYGHHTECGFHSWLSDCCDWEPCNCLLSHQSHVFSPCERESHIVCVPFPDYIHS